MKNVKKVLLILLASLLSIAGVIALTACDPEELAPQPYTQTIATVEDFKALSEKQGEASSYGTFTLTNDIDLGAEYMPSGVGVDTADAPAGPAPRTAGWETRFAWRGREWSLPMPGAHNVANAKAALEMALALGCDEADLARGLATFPGVRRRLERVGTLAGACVVDDYAHNVEKLAAAWATLAEAFPAGVFAVWRPHGYAPLRKLLDGLAAMFNAAVRPCDRLLLLPVYDAGGTTDRSLNSDALLARLSCPAELVPDLAAAEARLRALARPGTALVTFGARDPGLPALARRLAGLPA